MISVDTIKRVAVVGGGIMGNGIGQVLARNSYQVTIIDVTTELVETSIHMARDGPFGLQRLVEKGRLKAEEAEKIMSNIRGTTNLEDGCKDADLVIEAVPEVLSLKHDVFRKIDQFAPPHAVLASNTSGIMITDIATAVKRPKNLIGMHWFNPPPIMKLIEVVRGLETSDEVFAFMVEFCKKIGKVPVEAKDGPGFFTSRFLVAVSNEAIRLFEQGVAGIKEIDTMVKLGFNWPMGPFELMDLTGIDVIYHIGEYEYEVTKDEKSAPPISVQKMVRSGYLGKKPNSKGGWYDCYKITKD